MSRTAGLGYWCGALDSEKVKSTAQLGKVKISPECCEKVNTANANTKWNVYMRVLCKCMSTGKGYDFFKDVIECCPWPLFLGV